MAEYDNMSQLNKILSFVQAADNSRLFGYIDPAGYGRVSLFS